MATHCQTSILSLIYCLNYVSSTLALKSTTKKVQILGLRFIICCVF